MFDLFGRRAKRENVLLRAKLARLDNDLIYIKSSVSKLIARNERLEAENRELSLLVLKDLSSNRDIERN